MVWIDNVWITFFPEQTHIIDESMVPYFGKHGAKQYIHGKPITFGLGYKMWVIATPGGYSKQFYPYQGAVAKDTTLGIGGSLVRNLTYGLPRQDGPMYHIVFDNFFTSLRLLHHLLEKKFSGSGTMQNNRCMEAPLKYVKKIEKLPGGSFDVMLETNSNTSVFCWKDSAMTVASWFVGSRLLDTAITCNRSERGKIEIDQPRMIHVYITCVHYMWSTTQHMPYAARNGGGIPLYSNFALMLCSIIPFRYIKRRVFLQVSSLSTSSVHYLRVCQYLPENCSFTIKVWIYHIGIGRFW